MKKTPACSKYPWIEKTVLVVENIVAKKMTRKWLIVYYWVKNNLQISNYKNDVRYDLIKYMNIWHMYTFMKRDKRRKH